MLKGGVDWYRDASCNDGVSGEPLISLRSRYVASLYTYPGSKASRLTHESINYTSSEYSKPS